MRTRQFSWKAADIAIGERDNRDDSAHDGPLAVMGPDRAPKRGQSIRVGGEKRKARKDNLAATKY